MTLEEYRKQALANLRLMSRTANGEVDTSASADKEKIMAVSSGDTAKTLADRNFKEALKMAWENRFRVFSGPEDLRSFIEDLAREVNRGLLKDGVLYRSGADSEKYRYPNGKENILITKNLNNLSEPTIPRIYFQFKMMKRVIILLVP